MTDDTDEQDQEVNIQDLTPNQQWALIFNRLGQDRVRGMLASITAGLDGDADRQVIEVRHGDDGATVMDITDHVARLEDSLEAEYGSRPVQRDDDITEL